MLGVIDETNLVCVYDVDQEAASEVAKKHGATAVQTDEEAVNSKDVDAVLIASITAKHADQIELCAKAGKAVLCEKPIDLKLDRVIACRKVLDQHPVPVQLGFNRRFDAGHAAAHRAMLAGEIGELFHLIITARDPSHPSEEYYRNSGGLLRDMTIHDFDLARFFLCEEPTEVFAVVGRAENTEFLEKINDHDSSMIILRTESGKLCHINNTRSAVYGYDQRIELHGKKGMLISDNARPHNLKRYTKDATSVCEPLQYFFIDRYIDAYEQEIREFVEAVSKEKETPTSFNDGLRALQLAEAAYQSVATGKMVEIPKA